MLCQWCHDSMLCNYVQVHAFVSLCQVSTVPDFISLPQVPGLRAFIHFYCWSPNIECAHPWTIFACYFCLAVSPKFAGLYDVPWPRAYIW